MTITSHSETDEHLVIGGPDVAAVGTRVGAAEIDPATGPMPVIDVADGHVHLSSRRDVTIVAVDGGLDDGLAARVLPVIARAIEGKVAVILDLDHVTLLDRTALDAVCATLATAHADQLACIVAGRLSARLVLERWNVPSQFAVFSSVADALQARTFVESGYGNGWSPAPPAS